MKTEYFLFDGINYTIYVGKCREENDALVRSSSESDIWFHLADAPSCHVILHLQSLSADENAPELAFLKRKGLKNQEDIKITCIPRQVIKHCACLCVANSKTDKSRKSSKNVVSYTISANVSPTKHLGQVTIAGIPKTISV